MRYIGIRGHRGSGKSLITYVTGNIIDYMITTHEDPPKTTVDGWIDDIINDENIINNASLKNVYIDSFGDTVRTFVSLLIGCDINMLYDDYSREHVYVNMADFSYQKQHPSPEAIIIDNGDLVKVMEEKGNPNTYMPNVYMKLKHFILYFGHDVMKKYFGTNVWIKTLLSSQKLFENMFTDKSYKIFKDVKTSSEITYIKNNDGVIININRKDIKKAKGFDNLENDGRYNYCLNIPPDVHDIYDDILKICKQIIGKYYAKED